MTNDWEDSKALVMHEMGRLAGAIDRMDRQNREDHEKVVAELTKINIELSALKVKAGFYGALAGLGAAVSVFMAQIFGAGGAHS